MKLSGNTVLITGGGTGIGRGLAEQMHKLGNKVIIASRRRDVLAATAAEFPGMELMTLDVRDPEGVRRFAADIIQRFPDLNVVFNNAGIMRRENLLDQQADLADAHNTVETNLNGPIRLTAALLPHLQTKAQSIIVNTSSGLGFVPLVPRPTYCATKAGMHSYTVSLRHQLRNTNTRVFEIAPPGVQTELMAGQSRNPNYMPLPQFIEETMAQFRQDPPPVELLVERVWVLRLAEREGRFDAAVDALSGAA
ncbi:oxidoreductase [Bordetella sp. N]|nr:oxidoreductase [Bordetella sp. N]